GQAGARLQQAHRRAQLVVAQPLVGPVERQRAVVAGHVDDEVDGAGGVDVEAAVRPHRHVEGVGHDLEADVVDVGDVGGGRAGGGRRPRLEGDEAAGRAAVDHGGVADDRGRGGGDAG